MANGEPVTLEIVIEATPETVFEFFVDPRLMRRWMGGHADLDAQNGGRFAVDIGDNHARAPSSRWSLRKGSFSHGVGRARNSSRPDRAP